jgi:glutamate formiminotransferase/glutamate formiminotransferase/formiminotetrahydrofolate cyclodeaminase
VERPLEAVPNFSEGSDAGTIAALRASVESRAALVDVHTDVDHNRSVLSIGGSGEQLVAALVASVECARDRIDLRAHEGVHPRVGAADVVPVVAVWPEQMEAAVASALVLAERIGVELGLPVFLYGDAAPGVRPAHLRRGGVVELDARLVAGELRPDFGPERLHPTAGCVLVGARRPLIAFNVDLDSDDLAAALEIAAVVRESGGGFPGVRALGFPLVSRGLVQVSMNIEDWRAAPLPDVCARIADEAARRHVEVAGLELVGLIPAGAAAAVVDAGLDVPGLESRLLEARLVETAGARLGP